MNRDLKIVVLDDDPTGIQTVHGNLLLTQWDKKTLVEAFEDDLCFFYILTNTRAYTEGQVKIAFGTTYFATAKARWLEIYAQVEVIGAAATRRSRRPPSTG